MGASFVLVHSPLVGPVTWSWVSEEHPQEEVWNVIEGKLAVTIDGVEHIATPGCAAIVPPDTPHSARALSACRAIVVDYPTRGETGRGRPTEDAAGS
jgi:quercetin dioxygenase-like cupin family protein